MLCGVVFVRGVACLNGMMSYRYSCAGLWVGMDVDVEMWICECGDVGDMGGYGGYLCIILEMDGWMDG